MNVVETPALKIEEIPAIVAAYHKRLIDAGLDQAYLCQQLTLQYQQCLLDSIKDGTIALDTGSVVARAPYVAPSWLKEFAPPDA